MKETIERIGLTHLLPARIDNLANFVVGADLRRTWRMKGRSVSVFKVVQCDGLASVTATLPDRGLAMPFELERFCRFPVAIY